jgi:hypothetical protein
MEIARTPEGAASLSLPHAARAPAAANGSARRTRLAREYVPARGAGQRRRTLLTVKEASSV